MKPFLLRIMLVFAALGLVARAANAPVLPSSDTKKLAERYALTKARINALLGARLHPEPLPATTLPNPFYHGQVVVDTDAKRGPVSDAPDLTDIDTLAKYLAGLKVNGYLIRDGQPLLAVDDTVCKVGDVLRVGPKDHPVFLHLVDLNPGEATFRLNEATQVLALKK